MEQGVVGPLGVRRAARMAGVAPSTITRAIAAGKMSACAKDAAGHPLIDPAEVLRCFPRASLDRLRNAEAGAGATHATNAPPGAPGGQEAMAVAVHELAAARAELAAERQAIAAERLQWAEERRNVAVERAQLIALADQALRQLPQQLTDQRNKTEQPRNWLARLFGGGQGG